MRISVEQRRARLGVRQGLARRLDDPRAAAESVVALHATDPATVYLSAGARLTAPGISAVERALYDERTLVRMTGMRRTLFVVPSDLVGVVQWSSAAAIAAKERKTLSRALLESGFDAAWVSGVEAAVVEALREAGEASGAQLGGLVGGLREQIVYGRGKSYETTQSVGMRLLYLMAMEGTLVRQGRPTGTWISGAHGWALTGDIPVVDVRQAQAELVRRWLAAFGPGTEADIKWWTGWTLGDVRKALASVGAVPVTLDEGTGYVLADDLEVGEPEPWAAFLPALDPTPMGWQARDWYLPAEHRADLFDRTGNVGPTVWWNGGVVGGWATRESGEIAWELLEDVGSDARTAIEAEAARLSAWLGATKITPRFRTPLERKLST
ncbi:winged helix DNA-binding domain-containing protein [Nonomuraea sediminis]|uniref:winged helix DNA-binding domain-containing protein n=1 Tax=Nonomuraea sediminis TaxID=2835864 RepID=UPI001BDD65E4|nr:winged helix DNA-binding domain-containing protein [Nonomuraea sediminis]